MTITPWKVGQQAVIDRKTVVTIDRVSPSGRAVVGGRTFDVDGRERAGADRYSRSKLELLTPEIQAEMDLVARVRRAARDADDAIKVAAYWLSGTLSQWRRRVPTAADVERAERLAAAIREVMEDKP